MLKECLEVFEYELAKKGERLLTDTLVPADGTYLIVDKDGTIKPPVEIRTDKKTKTVDKSSPLYPKVCIYDYHSRLISMNKPMDSKKIIHSNNYLSFFVKKESIVSGKLTEAVIDDYYDVLKNPLKKYSKSKYSKSKEAERIYTMFEETNGSVDTEAAERYRQWIRAHIFCLKDVDLGRKDYLKIFFEADEAVYEREGKRYFIPNIYNSNDYNVEINDQIYGLPDNNLGMNAKKPFLAMRTKKCPVPYLLDADQVMNQKKFFDYLMNLVSAGRYYIYVDTQRKEIYGCKNGEVPDEIESGYYLRIAKGKNEAEIREQDNICGYHNKLNPSFDFKNIIDYKHEKHEEYDTAYHTYYKRTELGELISKVAFFNYLSGNYTTDASDIAVKESLLKQSILRFRDVIYDWVYKGIDTGFKPVMEEALLTMARYSILKNYSGRAIWQLNLYWSFREYFSREGEGNMAERISDIRNRVSEKVFAKKLIPIESDDEYYFAAGQMVAYLVSLSKAKDKKQSLVNPFLNAKNDETIKGRILQLYKKYNYDILENPGRVKNLLGMIMGYVPDGKVAEEMFMLGYCADNLIYFKEEK